MQARLARYLLRIAALPPLRVVHGCAGLIGRLLWHLPTRERANTRLNLQLCFAKAPAAERTRLGRISLQESMKATAELGWFWRRSAGDLLPYIQPGEGQHLLRDALDAGRGLVVLAPHLGAWEISTLVLKQHLPEHQQPLYLYRPPRRQSLEPLIRAARQRYGAELAPVSAAGMRQVLAALRQGRVIGILPDQEPDPANGVFAPFFGVQANTMTLVSRLLQKSGATPLFLVIERLADGRGYRHHFFSAEAGLADKDRQVAAAALNRGVEHCIQRWPEQYIWSYRRFRHLPDGSRRDYVAEAAALDTAKR